MSKKYPSYLKDVEGAKAYISDLTNSEYSVIGGEYDKKSKSRLKFKHGTCGYEFEAEIKEFRRSFLNSGGGCPKCAMKKRVKNLNQRITMDEFKEKFKTYDNSSEYEIISEDYTTNKDKIAFLHKDCNNEFEMRPNDFQQGYRCPICALKYSNVEKEVVEFIKSFYKGKVVENDRSLINPMELDIYLPDDNIAIEFNGLYWHSDKYIDKNYHKNKMEKCNEKGVQLIQIFEDEWKMKQNIVKSKLKNILGYSKGSRIYARKGTVKEISFEEAGVFLDDNHIQGRTNSAIKLGFFVDDKLYSVMLFDKLRLSMNSKGLEDSWDMIRFASSIEEIVIGSFSKMLKYFIRNYEVSYIKSIADLRWSSSSKNIYLTNGFTVSSLVQPRYFYTDGVIREHRFTYRKNSIKTKFPEIYDSNLTEFEMMDKTDLTRIWDAGKITYELRI